MEEDLISDIVHQTEALLKVKKKNYQQLESRILTAWNLVPRQLLVRELDNCRILNCRKYY